MCEGWEGGMDKFPSLHFLLSDVQRYSFLKNLKSFNKTYAGCSLEIFQ